MELVVLVDGGEGGDGVTDRRNDPLTYFFLLCFYSAAASGKIKILQTLNLAGATLEEKDSFGRQCIHAVGGDYTRR